MPKLPIKLFDAAVEQLLPFMATPGERQAELIPLLSSEPVFARIDWQGPSRVFTVNLVSLLSRDQLIAVLTRLPVGEPMRSNIKVLCTRIATEELSTSAPQTALRNAQQEPPRPVSPRPATDSGVAGDRAPRPVFISYAHADNEASDPSKRWLDRLRQHLEPLVQQDGIAICSDEDIDLGEDWHEHIQTRLVGAQAAVLLVSPAFLASKYIRNSELPVLLRNAKARGVKVIPVILRPCLFEETRFKYPDPRAGPEEFSLASLQAAGSPSGR